jgi:hypothetical protein
MYRQSDCSSPQSITSPNCITSELLPPALRERSRKLLLSMPQSPIDVDSYEVQPEKVAEALLARIDEMADERARFRRSLIYSVEMIEAPDLDTGSVEVK